MAIWHIDPKNGNDGNTGVSWAQAWATINGATAAKGVAAGDTVRIAKSPDPTSLGQAAQWTYGSRDVILQTGAVTANIDLCENAWVASANVSCTTYSSIRKQGSNCAKNTIAAAFGTGKAAYRATGSLDLSAYQQVSFWILGNVAVPANNLQLVLCSDASGDVPVHAFNIPALPGAVQWQALTLDNGSPLGASIQSVALYVATDFGAVDVYLDNILACKAPTEADSLTLNSLISKNSLAQGGAEGWYALQSINGTTLKIDNHTNCLADTFGLYAGGSETVALYKRETFSPLNCSGLAMAATNTAAVQSPQLGGSMDNLLEFSGGWDTALESQNGETFYNGINGFGYSLRTDNLSYIKYSHLNFVRYYGWLFANTTVGIIVEDTHTVSASTGNGLDISNSSVQLVALIRNINNNGNYGINCRGTNCNIITESLCGNSNYAIIWEGHNCSIGNPYGVCLIKQTNPPRTSQGGNNKLINPVFQNVASSSLSDYGGGILYYSNPIFISANIYASALIPNQSNMTLVCQNVDGVAGNHQIYTFGGSIKAQTSVVHTPGGIAWQFSPTSSYRRASWPLSLKVAEIAVSANQQVTVKAWMRRTHTGLTFSLVCRGGQIAGVPDDAISSMTAAADTWEEVALTFTPTEAGVVEIEVWAYGGTTYSGYVDDMSISQAA